MEGANFLGCSKVFSDVRKRRCALVKSVSLWRSAFLSPLVSSMEHQEIASELADEEHLNVGQCLRKSPGVFIAQCLQG